MNDNDLRNVSNDDYQRLMAEAYPSPKTDIHAAVMEQVMAEAVQSKKKTKILTPAFRNRFVKYGSIAACFVLLVTLGFRVVPMMTKDAAMETADMAAPEAAMFMAYDDSYAEEAAPEAGETVPETQADTDGSQNGSPVLFKTKLTGGSGMEAPAEEPAEEEIEEIIEEPAAVISYSTALADEIIIEEPVAEEAVEEAVVEEAAPEAPLLMMAPPPVAEEEAVIEECVEECIVEDAAAAEIAAPEYYRWGSTSDTAESVRRTFEYELKLDLSSETGEPAYTDWLTEHGYADVSHWSIAEFVADFGISRERFTELYDALADNFAQTYPEYEVVKYDLDKMYSMDADITDSIARGDMGYVTDALYRK